MSAPQPIDVYYWATPNGFKITIALEELGVPYNLHPIDISAGAQFKPEFLKISPNNKIPAIVDPNGPDGQPISVFESGVILQYLARKFGKLYGNNERQRINTDEWLTWQVSGLGPMAGQVSHFTRYAPALVDDPTKLTYSRERYSKEVNRLLGVLDHQLQGKEFITGDYSIADIASLPWVHILPNMEIPLTPFPNVVAWVERLKARPAVQRGLVAGKEHSKNLANLTPEQRAEATKILFGQTAKSVEEAKSAQRL